MRSLRPGSSRRQAGADAAEAVFHRPEAPPEGLLEGALDPGHLDAEGEVRAAAPRAGAAAGRRARGEALRAAAASGRRMRSAIAGIDRDPRRSDPISGRRTAALPLHR